jgi:hypothetical protein
VSERRIHAVVDRIEGDRAVLLVGDDEAEHLVAASDLPEGATEGSWLTVRREAPLEILGLDPEAEARQRQRVEGRIAALRTRGRRFGRSTGSSDR